MCMKDYLLTGVSTPCVGLAPAELRGKHQTPWNWSHEYFVSHPVGAGDPPWVLFKSNQQFTPLTHLPRPWCIFCWFVLFSSSFFFLIFISLENCLSSSYGSQHSISECPQLGFHKYLLPDVTPLAHSEHCVPPTYSTVSATPRNPASNTLALLSTLSLVLDTWHNRAHPSFFDLLIELWGLRWDFTCRL